MYVGFGRLSVQWALVHGIEKQLIVAVVLSLLAENAVDCGGGVSYGISHVCTCEYEIMSLLKESAAPRSLINPGCAPVCPQT